MPKLDLIAGIIILVFIGAVFSMSRIHQFADSHYSMLVSESLLHHGTFTLDSYAIPRLAPKQQIGYVSNGSIYQLELVNGHIYYFMPPGSSILSIPHVAVMRQANVVFDPYCWQVCCHGPTLCARHSACLSRPLRYIYSSFTVRSSCHTL